MATDKKIYGLFTFRTLTDVINKDWSKYDNATSLLEINKKANKLLETKRYHSIHIMVYGPKTKTWKLVSTKLRANL